MDSGYAVVCLYHNGKKYWRYVHRLVAITFIDIPEKYLNEGYTIDTLEVNHKDGSFMGKSINTIYNLEWNTSSDNKYHAYKHKLKLSGEDCPAAKYKNKQIELVCKLLEENELSNREIWKKTGVCVNTIQAILSRKQWKDISYKYDFSYHRKRHILYDKEVIDTVIDMLKTSDLSFLDIGNIVGMTRNSVWFLNRKHEIRK